MPSLSFHFATHFLVAPFSPLYFLHSCIQQTFTMLQRSFLMINETSLIIAWSQWKEGSICMKLLDNFNETFLMSAFKNVATIVLETIAELGGSGWHQFMTRPWLCSMFHVKVYEEANPSLHFASYFSHRIAARVLAKVSLIIIDRVPDYLVLLQLLQGWLDFTSLSRSAVEISRINHPLFLPHPPP